MYMLRLAAVTKSTKLGNCGDSAMYYWGECESTSLMALYLIIIGGIFM